MHTVTIDPANGAAGAPARARRRAPRGGGRASRELDARRHALRLARAVGVGLS